jgi:hypothetical protein
MAPAFSLGSAWAEQYVSGMVLLNMLLGQATAVAPLRAPDQESLLQTLQEIARGTYRPERYFRAGRASPAVLTLEPPPLAASQTYHILVLNASTRTTDFGSTQSGGIAFENPVWAIFAAQAIAVRSGLGVPAAGSNTELWARLSDLAIAVRGGNYSPAAFFGPVTGWVPPSAPPAFHVVEVTEAKLKALRERGIQSFGTPSPKLYELFERPAAR